MPVQENLIYTKHFSFHLKEAKEEAALHLILKGIPEPWANYSKGFFPAYWGLYLFEKGLTCYKLGGCIKLWGS